MENERNLTHLSLNLLIKMVMNLKGSS